MKAAERVLVRLKERLKAWQFERDVKGIRREIFRMLRHYDKISANLYTEEEKEFILKNLRNAEKSIGELFKRK